MQLPLFDRVYGPTIKLHVRLALMTLPLTIATAVSYAMYFVLRYVLIHVGIDPMLALDTQPGGGLAIVAVCIVMTGGFLFGALLGFFANPLVCRYVLRWDNAKIRRVFFEQQIPDEWRKVPQA